jgi:hypothetical protein
MILSDFKHDDWVTLVGDMPLEPCAGFHKGREVMRVHSADNRQVFLQDPRNPNKSNCYCFVEELRHATEEEIKIAQYQIKVNNMEIGDIVKMTNSEEYHAILGKKIVPELSYLVGENWVPIDNIELVCKGYDRLDQRK